MARCIGVRCLDIWTVCSLLPHLAPTELLLHLVVKMGTAVSSYRGLLVQELCCIMLSGGAVDRQLMTRLTGWAITISTVRDIVRDCVKEKRDYGTDHVRESEIYLKYMSAFDYSQMFWASLKTFVWFLRCSWLEI